MAKSYEDGMIDFGVMNVVLKLKWLKSYINNKQSLWYIIPNLIFKYFGGM